MAATAVPFVSSMQPSARTQAAGAPVEVDRNANRLANNLGAPVGHPTLAYKVTEADGAVIELTVVAGLAEPSTVVAADVVLVSDGTVIVVSG